MTEPVPTQEVCSEERIPPALGSVLTYFRTKFGWTKRRLAKETGKDPAQLTRYENGDQDLFRPMLRTLVEPFPLEDPEGAIDAFVFAHGLVFPERPEEPASPTCLTPAERRTMNRAVLAAGLAAAEAVRAWWVRWKKAGKTEAARREAEAAWASLQAVSPEHRRHLAAAFPEYRTVALAARVCEASVRAAAGKLGKARELAELALFIAERVEEPLRSRAQGYCWGFIGNTRRIAENFDGADEAFAQSSKLWEAGADCELLPEGRLLELEASLRRAQRQLPQALTLLDRARAACREDPVAIGRVLLQKEHVLDVMENIEGALAALMEAAPYVEASGDPRMLFALRFKSANILVGMERFDEAAERLPSVRELAVELRNDLDFIRVTWLAARVAAGQSRFEEAVAGLQLVRQDFLDHDLPYVAAVASLDLAVVWLRASRTAEVRELAVEMEAVFRAKKIGREALAALLLFCEAAKQETATVALARRTIADIEQVMRSASPSE